MRLNPYFNEDFFGFFWVLAQRLWGFITGDATVTHLVADEIQMLVLIGVSFSCALVGTFLVLRRMTMLANALSHTILLGIVLAFLMTHGLGHEEGEHSLSHLNLLWMLVAAALMGVITTVLTQLLTDIVGLQEDASIGLVFTSLFALGIVLVTLFTRNAHIGTEIIMGNVDGLHQRDLHLIFYIFLMNSALIFLFFKEYTITTFDPQLARTLGISALIFNYLLMLQTSITSIGSFRAVGVIMVLAFITAPPLTARLLSHHLRTILAMSGLIGAVSSILAVGLARHMLTVYSLPISTGGIVVCLMTLFFISALLFAPRQGIIAQWLLRRRLQTS